MFVWYLRSSSISNISLKYFYLCSSNCLKTFVIFKVKCKKINICFDIPLQTVQFAFTPSCCFWTSYEPFEALAQNDSQLPPPASQQHSSLQPIRHLATNHMKTLLRPKADCCQLGSSVDSRNPVEALKWIPRTQELIHFWLNSVFTATTPIYSTGRASWPCFEKRDV